MAFPRSGKQANFLHALDSDKQKGIGNPQMNSSSMSNPSMNLQSNQSPMGIKHMPQPKMPNLKHIGQQLNPVAVPSLPGLAKLPKFGKMRNSLKGEFKNK